MTDQDAFPTGFQWGAATAAFQIEGGVAADGRGPSIWDTFTARPGRIRDGDRADVAIDHYRRWRDDVALMAAVGLDTYRFSVSWSRVQPDGRTVNDAGLDFYARLVDELLANGITPLPTLYHWDHPQRLEDDGGWVARDTAERFADYAGLLAARLGDRVPQWITVNEPYCTAFLGHASGVHAPGRADGALALTAAHHLLLGHGLAVQALRATLPAAAQVSMAVNPAPVRGRDSDAVRRADALRNRLFLDPLFGLGYPADLLTDTAHVTDWGFVVDGDLKTASAAIDFLTVNYYAPIEVGQPVPGAPLDPYNPWVGSEDRVAVILPTGPGTTIHGAPDASGLHELLLRLRRDYPAIPVVIGENGIACADRIDADGRVRDPERIAYLRAHLGALRRAIADGVDVRGYLVWSLIDNFEWAYGYSQTFGLVHVDRASLRRTVKDSGHWFRRVAAANAVPAD
jgi:beta-glucosidase